jgi:pseudaminic acid synthase
MTLTIAGRPIGPAHPPYVVAEMSGNHNGDCGRALALIDAAFRAGADAVKLQTYTADTMTIDFHGPGFDIKGGLWDGRSLYELYQEARTPWEWHRALFERSRELGITIFSTAFDPTSVAFLRDLDVPAMKIASFEVTDVPLIEEIARVGKPIIMSTGMASDAEIAEALATIRVNGNPPVILLHCVSGYPTPPAESNLRRIPYLADRFGTPVGLSDHSMGIAVAVASVPLGACLVEKHFTSRRADGGPDAAFSLEPPELAELASSVRAAWEALGSAQAAIKPSEERSLPYRRSLYVVADIRNGEVFTSDNIRAIRPGYGMAPKYLGEVLGRCAASEIKRGTPLTWELVET